MHVDRYTKNMLDNKEAELHYKTRVINIYNSILSHLTLTLLLEIFMHSFRAESV